MIIPMKPENVRITLQLTSADFEAGEFTHDIDLQKLYDNRNSCAYEFAIDYDGQQISNAYQLFYDDGTLYAAVFFMGSSGTVKLLLSDGEGTITSVGGSGELPEVTSSNNGQVLTVVEGAWGAADPSSDLPAVSGADDGKVLAVSNGAWSAQNPSGGLQLYGPYSACNSDTVNVAVNTPVTVSLDALQNFDGDDVEFPTDVENIICLIDSRSFNNPKLSVTSISSPYYDDIDTEWVSYLLYGNNIGDSDIEINPWGLVVNFYTNVPLPEKIVT